MVLLESFVSHLMPAKLNKDIRFFQEGTNTTVFIELLTSADVKRGPYAVSFPYLVGSPVPFNMAGWLACPVKDPIKLWVESNFL